MPVPPPPAVRDAAKEILSRPEFRQPPQSFYDRVTNWLSDQLDRVISALVSGGRGSVVAWLALVVVVGVIAFFVWRAVRGTRRDPRARHLAPLDIVTDVRRTATAWEQDAVEHERARRWRDALRCRYCALVVRLGSAGVVDGEDPSRTTGEHRAQVRHALPPTTATSFDEAADLFERAWYGQRPTGEVEDRRFQALAGDVLAVANAMAERAA